ncbi:MAG: hypothetical protein ACREUG_06005, partial [Steroidobacteraceae bacterium]
EYRLATVVGTLEELRGRLQRYVQGEEVEELYVGEVKRNKEALVAFEHDASVEELLATWVAQGKHGRLLDLWVKGLSINWRTLLEKTRSALQARPRRLSLPTYPFARERHWVPATIDTSPQRVATPSHDKTAEREFLVRLLGQLKSGTIGVDAASSMARTVTLSEGQAQS